MNKKKDCEPASFLEEKQSDNKKLSVATKILIALIHKQPLKRVDLIERAGVDPASFSRIRRLLLKNKGIKKTRNGYCLYNFIEQTSLWGRVQKKCLDASGPVIDLTLKKLVLGDQHPVTGHFKTSYDDVSIHGIMIHKGATELRAIASAIVPLTGDYYAFLLTQDGILEGDRLLWRDEIYEIKETEEILDGNKFSFTIAKLIFIFNTRH